MIGGHRVVALVTARAGSKGVPGKNIRPLGGVPLIAWTIAVARATPEVDRVIVSTDGEAIADAARAAGAEVAMRPAHLATDTALSADVVRHSIAELRAAGDTARIMVLLQPTSPFRRPADISDCLRLMERDGLDSAASFTEADLHPHRAWTLVDGRPETYIPGAVPWLPRQALTSAYQLNGSVYAFVMDALPASGPAVLFGRMGGTLMDRTRSLDIDDETDFLLADALLARGLVPGLAAACAG